MKVQEVERAPVAEVERMFSLCHTRFQSFNVRHFLRIARPEHGPRFCYAFVKRALQGAGLTLDGVGRSQALFRSCLHASDLPWP